VSQKFHRAALISRFHSPQTDTILNWETMDRGIVIHVVYIPAFAGTHCT